MDKERKCDCSERIGIRINSMKLFDELKYFFDTQVSENIFSEQKAEKPFYSWANQKEKREWYATKWYRCNCCGCLWEFEYPDFPAQGFVRKFPDGIYRPK